MLLAIFQKKGIQFPLKIHEVLGGKNPPKDQA